MTRRSEADVMDLVKTLYMHEDAVFWDGWRSYGEEWAWDYLQGYIDAGAERREVAS